MPIIFFKKTYHLFQDFAAKLWIKFYPNVKVVGVTGSYGKTSTVGAIYQVLSEEYSVLKTDDNLDTIFNIPLTILRLRPRHKFMVLEYGVDHRGEMKRHLSFVSPVVGVITGITPVHADKALLGSLTGIIEEKSMMISALPSDGIAILNYDDDNVRKIGEKAKAPVIWCGSGQKCQYSASDIKVTMEGTSFRLTEKAAQKNPISFLAKTNLIGRHSIQPCLMAAAVGRYFGLDWSKIIQGLAKIRPMPGRLSIEPGPFGSVLLNDSLRANPASTVAGLTALADLPGKRKIAVLGEMGELGDFSETAHQAIGRKVAELKIDYFVAVGPLQKLAADSAIKAGMNRERVFWAENVSAAAEVLREIIKKGDLFYLKGSLLRHMERIILILSGKQICCDAVSCHHYNNCATCERLNQK